MSKKNLVVYEGNDLGAVYSKDQTSFRLWAPTAETVSICFYANGDGGEAIEVAEMEKSEGGTWIYVKNGDLHKLYYTYKVTVDGVTQETNDPYAKAAGVNGRRSMVVNLEKTNPEGFAEDKGPEVKKWTDIVVYEMSILDTTMDETCGAKNPGKYIGLTETGLKTPEGVATGLDHILDLGVTHVQIMPAYDFGSIDESKSDVPQYNWGYDPVNYNTPEGSYSTNAFDPYTRIREMKEMVQALHRHGIRVILDVVYNHTYINDGSNFSLTTPGYYYRHNEDGSYAPGSRSAWYGRGRGGLCYGAVSGRGYAQQSFLGPNHSRQGYRHTPGSRAAGPEKEQVCQKVPPGPVWRGRGWCYHCRIRLIFAGYWIWKRFQQENVQFHISSCENRTKMS